MPRGFEQLVKGESHTILVSEVVAAFLEKHRENRPKDVMKIGQILNKLAESGLQGVNNTEQFRREGKFSDGSKGGSDVSVYAIKAYQLRVYGGIVNHGSIPSFYCIDAALKKKNKADRSQLKRVAKSLGELK